MTTIESIVGLDRNKQENPAIHYQGVYFFCTMIKIGVELDVSATLQYEMTKGIDATK
jgi:hypothetical protein